MLEVMAKDRGRLSFMVSGKEGERRPPKMGHVTRIVKQESRDVIGWEVGVIGATKCATKIGLVQTGLDPTTQRDI